MLRDPILYSFINQHAEVIDDFEEHIIAGNFTHYASQLIPGCIQDEENLSHALNKALLAISSASLPLDLHFKKVFISKGGLVCFDWLLSDLAFQLMILNADSSNSLVAKLQVEILTSHLKEQELEQKIEPQKNN